LCGKYRRIQKSNVKAGAKSPSEGRVMNVYTRARLRWRKEVKEERRKRRKVE